MNVGDPLGIYRIQSLTWRAAKVHFGTIDEPICNQRSPKRATVYEPEVTCCVCLYWLGRYVPLSKLALHQHMTRERLKRAAGAPYAGR